MNIGKIMLSPQKNGYFMKSPQKKKKIASLVQCRPKCARGFRVSEIFCKRVPKARACKKFSLTLNPRNPTNRKATTNQIQEIRTFFRLGLGKKTRIHALWGLAWASPPKSSILPPKTLFTHFRYCTSDANIFWGDCRNSLFFEVIPWISLHKNDRWNNNIILTLLFSFF